MDTATLWAKENQGGAKDFSLVSYDLLTREASLVRRFTLLDLARIVGTDLEVHGCAFAVAYKGNIICSSAVMMSRSSRRAVKYFHELPKFVKKIMQTVYA